MSMTPAFFLPVQLLRKVALPFLFVTLFVLSGCSGTSATPTSILPTPAPPTTPVPPPTPAPPTTAPTAAPMVSPSSMVFAETLVGSTSPIQLFTVTAPHGDAITARLNPGGNFALSQTSTCAAGAATCQIAVTFIPASTGQLGSALLVTDTATSLSVIVPLTGTGVRVPLPPMISAAELDFGSVEIGLTSPTQTIVATPQSGDALTAQLATAGPYQILSGAVCSAGTGVCPVAVVFNPTGTAPAPAVLTIADTDNGLFSTIALKGAGYGNAGAMSGLAYYLPFSDGKGLTVTDSSGNGRNATISGAGTLALWTSTGLSLNGQVATIPAAAGLPTFGMCAYFPAATARGFTHYQFVRADAAKGVNGYSFYGSYGPGIDHGSDAFFPEIGRSNGAPVTLALRGISGNHCVEAVIGSSERSVLDRIFIDGQEVNYLSQGMTDDTLAPPQTTNAIIFSGEPDTSVFPSPVTIYSAWAGINRDTAGQASARSHFEMTRLGVLGVQFGLPDSTLTDSSCSITGTSIDVGATDSHAPSDHLNLDFPCILYNFAVNGQASKDMVAGFQDREGGVYHRMAARNIAYNGGVTNGVVGLRESPANALQDVLDWNAEAHAQGWKTIASTMLSRYEQNGYNGESGDVLKQQFNALLLANADQFDWVANQAAAPQLGADNAYASSSYFSDGIHPNDAGQVFYIATERAAFEGMYRTASTPIVGAYTQIPSDAFIVAGGSKPYTVTLMDANTANFNKNGRTCVINNGSVVVTLAAMNGETIGGAATLSVAAGATICFRATMPDPVAAGAVWSVVP